jgi:dihydropteroate synthase
MPLTFSSLTFKKTTVRYGEKLLEVNKPWIFGILNVTPDSFYAGSRTFSDEKIEQRIKKLIEEGSSAIDIGAYSSRPDAEHILEEEEFNRLVRAFTLIKRVAPTIPISVDTFRASIVRRLHDHFGAFIVNDISGGELDSEMFVTVAELKLPYILMHMQGTPQNMQNNPQYKDVISEIIDYFVVKIAKLRQLGVNDIILDPGFGFGKTLDHNYELLNRLEELHILGLPLFIGVSRKSMLYKLLGNNPADVLNATTVVNTISLMKGAAFLRVHDVAEANEAVKIVLKMEEVGKKANVAMR